MARMIKKAPSSRAKLPPAKGVVAGLKKAGGRKSRAVRGARVASKIYKRGA